MSELSDHVALLHAKTNEGKIKWHVESDDRITTKQGDSIVEFQKLFPPGTIALKIRNRDGIVLAEERFAGHMGGYRMITDIYDKARRASLGVDRALEDLKSRLLQL